MLFKACLKDNENKQITVNSSEYALGVYKKMGFIQMDSLKDEDGIRFIPMTYDR